MISTSFCISAKAEFLRGIHQPGHTYKIALYEDSASLGANTTHYSPTNEITGRGYIEGGQTLGGYSVTTDGRSAVLTFDTPVWNASTITARGALIYNASKGNRALGTFDFGGEITSTNGPFTAHIPAATEEGGLIVIG